MASATAPKTKPYFGYGSNLWQDQMRRRCPESVFTGIGRVKKYYWFINSRGYANVGPTESGLEATEGEKEEDEDEDEVWGLIYDLTPDDEDMLDLNEGVPEAYEKRMAPIEFWPVTSSDSSNPGNDSSSSAIDVSKEGEKVDMLVYIDFRRNKGGFKPRDEYIVRMNHGIDDALRAGVPQAYVERVLRAYIPESFSGEKEEEKARELARRQAGRFEDESGVITGSGLPAVSGSGSGMVSGP